MIQTGSTTQLGLYEFKGEVAKAVEKFENTGGFISRATLAELNTTTPEYDYQLARVDATGDEYRWNPALTTTVKWEATGRNFLGESKAYTDSKVAKGLNDFQPTTTLAGQYIQFDGFFSNNGGVATN